MVFPGRFSTGCLRCRQRKVKCDEAKPSCRRCEVYGKPCTGYTDQFHFRHTRAKSNASTVTLTAVPIQDSPPKAQPPSQPKSHSESLSLSPSPSVTAPLVLEEEYVEEQQQQHQRRQSQPWDDAVAVIRPPEPSYDDASLFYFVRRFVSPNPADGFPGHLSFLPSLYDSGSRGLLETATLSVAQMAAYNKFGGDKFRVQSYRNYGIALRMLQDIVQAQDQVTDDKVMASILLLCTLQDISGDGAGEAHEHAPGLYYLIEKRGPEQMATSRGAELLFLALIRLQIHSFLHEDDTYVDPGAIATVWGAFNPLLRAMTMMSRTLSLRHRLKSTYTTSPVPDTNSTNPFTAEQRQAEEATIIQGCFETLEEFYNWDSEAATYWASTFDGRGVPTALGQVASGTMPHYDVETACTIILIRSARLILLMTMIAYHHSKAMYPSSSAIEHGLYEHNDPQGLTTAVAQCLPFLEQDVVLTIDDILASVPYALGDVDSTGLPCGGSVPHDGAAAIVIVHSIRLVASCAYATEGQTQKAVEVLARLNGGIGIRAAVGLKQEDVNCSRWASEQVFLRSLRTSTSAGIGQSYDLSPGMDEMCLSSPVEEWFSPMQCSLDEPLEQHVGTSPVVGFM